MSDKVGDVELKTIDPSAPHEEVAFIQKPVNGHVREEQPSGLSRCCRSKHTSRCCVATAVLGALFIVVGVAAILVLKNVIAEKVLKSMALTPGSDRTKSWLTPPVQPHLTAYAFDIQNGDDVLLGEKPILVEKGPFVYKAVTIKDTEDNMRWDEKEGLLTYRPRKVYSFVPELSAPGYQDPDNIFVTVPNIPFWTGIHKVNKKGAGRTGVELITSNAKTEPFINVSINGLLWGYAGSDLPCLNLNRPKECNKGEEAVQFSDDDDDFADFGSEDFISKDSDTSAGETEAEKKEPDFEIPKDSIWEPLVKPKAEYVDCNCEWGLFRDRNVTLRQPVTFYTGTTNLSMKGVVSKYDGKDTLGWWKKGSSCDAVKGQDAGTLPPGIKQDQELEIFIDLMCRTIKLKYEQDVEHANIRTYRFVPPENAMGAHDDPNPARNNPENECYCMKHEKYTCFKSGVLYMEPCKRDSEAPLALSYPHFYQADESFLEAVEGLSPNKEKHQFFVDVVPEFGFPLAIRPRFQLNMVLNRNEHHPRMKKMKEQIVMPFMWAEDGFGEPSKEMAAAIAFGLSAPDKLPTLLGIACFVVGAILILASLIYFVWMRRTNSRDIS